MFKKKMTEEERDRLGKEKAMQWLGTTIEEDEARKAAEGVTKPNENVSVGGRDDSLNKIVVENPLAFEEPAGDGYATEEFSDEEMRAHYEEMRAHWSKREGVTSDGSSASYYFLPKAATELYHLIIYKNMNAQIGEIFRSAYRYGESSHSDMLRDAKKIKAYAEQEIERLERNL